MPAKIPQDVREKQLNSLPGKRFVRWLDGYRDRNSKAVMQCSDGHEWATTVHSLMRSKSGCPFCAGTARVSRDVQELRLDSAGPAKFVRWLNGYSNNRSRAVMVCPDGHEWDTTPKSVVDRGRGCPLCAGNRKISRSVREDQLRHVGDSEFVSWVGKYENSYSYATMKCRHGHMWSAAINSIINDSAGCPKCSGKYRYSQSEREEQLNNKPGATFVRWVGVYKNSNSRAVMRCDCGREWDACLNSLANSSSGCPSCADYGYNPSKPGVLYALRSACGAHIKIGISNNLDRRVAELTKHTPFEFHIVAKVSRQEGRQIAEFEKSFHRDFVSSGFCGFSGATEWLKFDPAILDRMQFLAE